MLFDGDRVAGIIDFGFAATDFLAYDVAIAVNDWCEAEGALDARARRAHSSPRYHAVRPLTADERDAVAGAAARRRAALLAVAAVRPAPAAARRARARARSGALRAHPARARRGDAALPELPC
ncbi:MAG: phosphotransferase [Chromatiales bacterium]|nr:phosphotransferase [Chromatiales bacterium]